MPVAIIAEKEAGVRETCNAVFHAGSHRWEKVEKLFVNPSVFLTSEEEIVDMLESTNPAPGTPPTLNELAGRLLSLCKRILAGNPFYLASAGLLLYGLNELTTDSHLVGAELPLLRFNFCALVLYEMMLVGTAILLVRRNIWYDALLLFGLTNLFVIVPFSLISRAVFLSPHLALAMSICGVALAVAKFGAFKRYAPELNLPGRLLVLGALLLLVNASAPLLFKHIALDLDRVGRWLNFAWEFLLPALAGLGILLPRAVDRSDAPGGKKWLPATIWFGWIAVTACHFGGLGYSNSYVWNFPLLVPLAWVMAWTVYVRLADFGKPTRRVEQTVLSVPLLLPLPGIGDERIVLLFAGLNLVIYALLFLRKDRTFSALARLLGATVIFCGSLPMAWANHIVPGVERSEWVVLSIFIGFFWLIFRFRDPRVAIFSALALMGLCGFFAADFIRCAVEVALVSLLAHSLRWDDPAHKGAAMLRFLASLVWSWVSCAWLFDSVYPEHLLVYSAAGILLVAYLGQAIMVGHWRPRIVLLSASFVLLSKPGLALGSWLNRETPGMLAVAGSFLLFGLGSLAAFSKPKWWRRGAVR